MLCDQCRPDFAEVGAELRSEVFADESFGGLFGGRGGVDLDFEL